MDIPTIVKNRIDVRCSRSEFNQLMNVLEPLGFLWADGSNPAGYDPFCETTYIKETVIVKLRQSVREKQNVILFNSSPEKDECIPFCDLNITPALN